MMPTLVDFDLVTVGAAVGAAVGVSVGASVGAAVGASVVHAHLPSMYWLLDPELEPAGQSSHVPVLRSVDDCPELVNMEVKSVTEQTFQPSTSWLKALAELHSNQYRMGVCEFRFACACVC